MTYTYKKNSTHYLVLHSRQAELEIIPKAPTCYDHLVAYAESFRRGAKVSSQSCDVTNKLGECRRHDHYRVVRGQGPEKFCKIIPKNTHFHTGQIGSFSKTKKAFAYTSKSRENPEYSQKTSFAFAKTAWFYFTVFHL